MVSYQDLINTRPGTGLVIPPPGEPGSCYSGDLFGVCFKIKNQSPSQTITSSCPTPTPNPPPAGCLQMHVIPWQCYTAVRDFPAPFDPGNPTAFEGQHCDNTGLLIPCPESVYNLDDFLPPGGLGPLAELWVDLSFLGGTPPTPANGVNPIACFGSSFIGLDLLFREPSGDCATPSTCDWQAGIRSAKDGPSVEVTFGTRIFVPAGVFGCVPVPPATRCTLTCNAPTCQASWDFLVNHEANYPTLRFNQAGSAVKNWLLDARF
jgi:hypothetical protein